MSHILYYAPARGSFAPKIAKSNSHSFLKIYADIRSHGCTKYQLCLRIAQSVGTGQDGCLTKLNFLRNILLQFAINRICICNWNQLAKGNSKGTSRRIGHLPESFWFIQPSSVQYSAQYNASKWLCSEILGGLKVFKRALLDCADFYANANKPNRSTFDCPQMF